MRALKIEDGDLVIDGSGNFVEVEGEEEEVQSIERALTTRKGEWFLNAEHGLDYDPILAKPFDEEAARAAITDTATQDDRVAEVSEVQFQFHRPNRHLDIRVVALMAGRPVEVVVPIE